MRRIGAIFGLVLAGVSGGALAQRADVLTAPPSYTPGSSQPFTQTPSGGVRMQLQDGAGNDVSATTPLRTKPGTIVWIAPALVSITVAATVVAAGPAVSVVTNATAAGGGNLTLNLFGTAAVANTGIVLAPGATASISGQSPATPITGVCSTGTCTVAVQSGS